VNQTFFGVNMGVRYWLLTVTYEKRFFDGKMVEQRVFCAQVFSKIG
jgi:hypothetical protein